MLRTITEERKNKWMLSIKYIKEYQKIYLKKEIRMSKQEILDRVQDILNQDGNIQALDLLRHDLENEIINETK